MAGFRNLGEYSNALTQGRVHTCSFRKVPSQASTAGWWVDYSMASGNPVPNYYAATPLVASALDGFKGIFHGDDKSPASMHLVSLSIATQTAAMVGRFTMLDYLLFYPFVDCDDTDVQVMDNTTTLPRYTDGAGVMAMAVVVAPTTGGGSFTFTYINQDGVEKVSPVQACNSVSSSIATVETTQQAVGDRSGPYLRLAGGDTGIRSIVSAQFTVANGGLISLVLVKPLINIAIREINTPAEVMCVAKLPGAPRVYDGAYLNLIGNVAGSVAAGTFAGLATFAWSD